MMREGALPEWAETLFRAAAVPDFHQKRLRHQPQGFGLPVAVEVAGDLGHDPLANGVDAVQRGVANGMRILPENGLRRSPGGHGGLLRLVVP